MSSEIDPYAYAPRAMSLEAAARYLAISPSKFSALVAEGRLPKPRKIDRRSVWDRHALDSFFEQLPTENTTPRDSFLARFPLKKAK